MGRKLSFSMRLPLFAAVIFLLLPALWFSRPVVLLPDFLLPLGHVERFGLRDHLIERSPGQCARLLEQDDLVANTIRVGIERIPNAPANSCCSSVFTLANTTSGYASDARS